MAAWRCSAVAMSLYHSVLRRCRCRHMNGYPAALRLWQYA
ncbi:hypothetical protein I553_3233 [Mycobacterium xenopi 4042]|uniref:Uncharacterized protein n=1 Tax=Mycobacterium xenopi 4042 TaxID=1299334 RepID=X8E562_MYCXE|nr:hypothetical protein I552_0919 [Mycobacterium xenopi 3993]EUA75341.1 hypothetical protein I553_3233 [Mycobacterium xenopi 4042]